MDLQPIYISARANPHPNSCVCVCACMCVCNRVRECVRACARTHACVHSCLRLSECEYLSVSVCVCVFVLVRVSSRACPVSLCLVVCLRRCAPFLLTPPLVRPCLLVNQGRCETTKHKLIKTTHPLDGLPCVAQRADRAPLKVGLGRWSSGAWE